MHLSHILAFVFLGSIQEKTKYVHTKTCIQMFIAVLFIINQKLGTVQVSLDRCVVEQSVAHPHHGMLFSNKKGMNY